MASLSQQINSSTGQHRQHHPVIAQYLGFGAEREPSRLGKYVPALILKTKRTRKAQNSSSSIGAAPSPSKKPRQSRNIDHDVGFRVTKPTGQCATATLNNVLRDVSLPSPNTTKNDLNPPRKVNEHVEESRKSICGAETWKTRAQISSPTSATTLTQAFKALANSSSESSSTLVASNANRDRCPFSIQREEATGDEFFDDVFDSMDLDSTLDQVLAGTQPRDAQTNFGCSKLPDSSATVCTDADFMSAEFDSLFQSDGSVHESNLEVSVSEFQLSNTSGPSGKFVSPVTPKTAALIRKEALTRGHTADRKPIARPLFPDPVRDRSPVIGLSSKAVLKTCFRVGEAIHQAGKASREGQHILFELYAKVLSSERDTTKQHFVFSDLFHDRPPYLKGEFDAVIWKHVELFNYDSGRFLSKAKMCRCIGKMKRLDSDRTWVMEILNIWEATWDDIEWVEGIVSS